MFYMRLKRFMGRPDVRQNPVQALLKRLWWRIWWSVTDKPYVIPFAEKLKIGVSKSGSASLIYYQGFSELDTADFIRRFLRPGMVFLDVGAHIGEYTLLAAQSVGASGEVHGFEPQANLFPILSENVRMNSLSNVILNCSAVSDHIGEIEFEVGREPSVASIRKHTDPNNAAKFVQVACTSLDTYWCGRHNKIDLIKVDVEGAENLVFQGAEGLLSLPSQEAPTWIFEYSPNNYACFGYQASDLLELLKRHNYQVWQYCGAGKIADFNPAAPVTQIINLIAAKDKTYLLSLLQGESIPVTPEYAQA